MKRIYLYGHLKEKFGEYYDFDVSSPRFAIRALLSQIKDFGYELEKGEYVLVYGNKETGISLDETELNLKFGKTQEFHIIPHVSGSGGKTTGVIKIVLGVALLAVGVGAAVLGGAGLAGAFSVPLIGAVSYGSVASLGIALALGGVAMLMTPKPQLDQSSYDARELADDRQSFLYNGAINKSEQGQPVPLVYGRIRTGSVVVSAGLSTEAA